MARTTRTLKDYIVSHKGNNYKPLVFTAGGVAVAVIGLLLVQAAYVLQTTVVFSQTNFLASVLPGVLSSLANEDRTRNGVTTLVYDPLLAQAAQLKAEDMAAKGYFAHVDPSGNAPWYWFESVGYQYSYAGENLAVDFTDSEDVEEAWMNSPTHRANIVKPQYSHIGIGTAEGMYEGEKTTFVVQFFAAPQQGAYATAESASVGTLALEPVPGKVLGAETENADEAVQFLSQAAASPTHTVIYILSALIVLFVLLLSIAVFSHAQARYLEVIGAGLVIILVASGLLVYNALIQSGADVPDASKDASIVIH